VNQQTIDAINQWASQIQNAIVIAAPKVWQVAVTVKRADSIGALVTNIIEALVRAGVAIPLAILAVRSFKQGRALDDSVPERERSYGQVTGWAQYVVAGLSAVGSVVTFCFAWSAFAAVVFDQWVWIGATNPGLAVSHDIILKVLSQ
jgi:hypothetical protein